MHEVRVLVIYHIIITEARNQLFRQSFSDKGEGKKIPERQN